MGCPLCTDKRKKLIHHAKASEVMRLSEMPAATSLFNSLSGRKVILCPLIIEAGEKSLAAIVSYE